MEPEDVGVCEDGDCLNELEILLVSLEVRHDIIVTRAREEELLVRVEDEVPTILLQVRVHHASVIVIGDTTSHT